MQSKPNARPLQTVAKALSRQKRAVAQCLFDPLVKWAKWESDVEALGAEQVIQMEIRPAVDYLIRFLRTDDVIWRDMYLCHLLEQMHRPGEHADSAFDLRREVLDQQREALLRLLRPLTDPTCVEAFDRHLRAMHEIVTTKRPGSLDVRILFVGDCLFEHVTAFLTIPLIERGVTLHYELAASKNPIELRNSLRKLSGNGSKFDLVCYSPYTVAFNTILYPTLFSSNFMRSRHELRKMAADAHQQTQLTLRLLTELFDCGIYVQNTNHTRSNDGTPSSAAKNLLTRRPRAIVADEVNALLDRTIAEMNREMARPLVTIDEIPLKKQHGELALGKLFYADDKHHPSVLAQHLSVFYGDLILANKLLSTKKVVVVDLDDTVWKGTIGEGAVEHYSERQQALRDLKLKGVLLTIVSRNDPKNVHWTGGVLQSGDFVAAQVNWDPKPNSIRRIAAELNLKLKDFIFIDDRADQRELVKSSIPEIQVLDANLDSSWEMLRWWAASLPEQNETDRTQLYLERKQRESFLNFEAEAFDENALFGALELKLNLHIATPRELPRVAELINRTNQFNTCGSRTSPQQVAGWSQSSEHLILVAQARDKFGDMGIISVMVLDVAADALVVRAWVLSCRVFGYGMEAAMLNHARRLGRHLHRASIHARIVETANNQPCREVYAGNGFEKQDTIWVSRTADLSAEPPWLEIAADDSAPLAAA